MLVDARLRTERRLGLLGQKHLRRLQRTGLHATACPKPCVMLDRSEPKCHYCIAKLCDAERQDTSREAVFEVMCLRTIACDASLTRVFNVSVA